MNYNQAVAAELETLMRDIPGAKPGKMFGMPAYKVNGKLAAAMFENGVVIKLGAPRTAALVGTGSIQPFEPLPGRVWKEWVVLTGDLSAQRGLLEEAVRYVTTLS